MGGQSLLEVLISLSIGLGLLLIGYGLCSNSEWQGVRVQQSLQLQNDQLWCGELLQRAVQGANLGLLSPVAGGSAASVINTVQDPSGRVQLAPKTALEVYDASSAAVQRWGLNRAGSGQLAEGSKVLVVRSLSVDNAVLQQAVAAGAQEWLMSADLAVTVGDVLVIGDGEHEVAERVTAVKHRGIVQTVSVAAPMPVAIAAGALVARFDWAGYYVGLTGRKNAAGQALTGLYVQDLSGVRQELVPDVSALQVSVQPARADGAVRWVRLQLAVQVPGVAVAVPWSAVFSVRLVP